MTKIHKAPRAFPVLRVLALALAGTAILYARTLGFGFDWDDYHFVRPYGLADIASAFTGTWEPQGIEPPFYRPGTIALFATRGWLAGTNAAGLHALNLALFVAVVVLFAYWLDALDMSFAALAGGTAVFLVHPMTAPAVAWITNQMHLLQLALVFAALGLALRVHWGLLIALQGAALLVKEDSLVLPFAIAVTLWARRRPVPRGWIVASVILSAAYLFVRTAAIGGVGGYQPGAGEMLRNLGRAAYYALFVFPFNGGLYTAVAVLFLLLAAWRAAPGERRLLVLMASLFALVNVPLSLASGPTRWHLVAASIAGGIAVSVHALRAARWSLPLAAAIVVAFGVSAWQVTGEWQPCSAPVRAHDARVETWGAAVVPDLREKLSRKAEACTSDPSNR